MNAEDIKQEILSWIKNAPKLNGCAIPSDGERGVVIGLMNSALRLGADMGTANARRHMVLAYLFRDLLNKPMASAISAKDLNDEMWWALCRYVNAFRDSNTGRWVGKLGFEDDMVTCLNAIESWQRDFDKQLGFDV